MSFKYNSHTLDRLELILKEAGYQLRYEKGTFNSGYCILEEKKVVVANRFLDVEGRINTLLDILSGLPLAEERFGEESLKFYRQALQGILPDAGRT